MHDITQVWCISKSLCLGQDTIDCQWGDFVDEESHVAYYKVGVGRGEGDDSAVTFQHVDGRVTQFTLTGKALHRALQLHVLYHQKCVAQWHSS